MVAQKGALLGHHINHMYSGHSIVRFIEVATVKILGFHCAENAQEMYPKFGLLVEFWCAGNVQIS